MMTYQRGAVHPIHKFITKWGIRHKTQIKQIYFWKKSRAIINKFKIYSMLRTPISRVIINI